MPCLSFYVVTGMEASVDMYTSSLGHKGLYLHMILPMNILTVTLMPISGLATAIIGEISVVWTLFGFAILTNHENLLKTSWSEAVFGILKDQLRKASLTDDDAFAFLKGDNCDDFVTYSTFCEALRQVNLIGLPCGLCLEEVKDLWAEADLDGNGLDFEEFKQKIWNSTCSERGEESLNGCVEDSKSPSEEEGAGFNVKNAALFPREVERGMWPEDYSLSDHARLTVTFTPVRMQCAQSDNLNYAHL
ncbi:Calcium-binding endonuclease/exonuclease/phosphatase family [Quillaja saponaria]|uniref:Calcium-binding endonuclease/exonuclease/phosphatase family n=1 Tax=Quillaja saponaria TaxID=32244 RepID=A0AAD7PQR0_QUISA|nr:Calcium-binding endonuclease/exonuclease/phosphatase family [Quillaja saponaria]